MTTEERRRRRFSEEFRREQVALIEQGELSIADVSRLYEVRANNVRKWVKKYGKTSRYDQVVITTKEEVNRIKDLEKEVENLKKIIGGQQVKVVYLEGLLNLAKKELGADFEKKVSSNY